MRLPFRAIFSLTLLLFANGHVAMAEPPSGGSRAQSDPAHKKERPYHPEPRVIVIVISVRGPHNPARVQHDARFGWKRIVGCYKKHGPYQKTLLELDLVVSGEGKLARVSNVRSDASNHELEQCLADKLPGLSMPKAPADSTANVEIQLAPGDPPPN
jgi:hypothetical protein